MSFSLPDLPYKLNGLEPHLSEQTVTIHYTKHTVKYFDTTNKLIKGTVFEKETDLEKVLSKDALVHADSALFNNAAQSWNHVFYFEGLAPAEKCGEPSSGLSSAITSSFGSFDSFKDKMTEACVSQFGSGWGWLTLKENRLSVFSTPNANNPLTRKGVIPLLCIDVWEHAYYLDTQNKRDEYLKNIWNVINWNKVNERYDNATTE